jgi:hypothetical protein
MPKRKVDQMRGATFVLVPWKWETIVLVGGCEHQLDGFVAQFGMSTDGPVGYSMGHTFVYAGQPIVMWVKSLKHIPELCHEVIHVVGGALEARGVKPCEASEEAYAYTAEAFLKQILECKKWRTVRV